MPCPHACNAIFEKGDNPEEYCSNYYSPAAYHATNGKSIAPINGENMCPKVNCDTIIPPVFRVKPGRPRMVQIREPDENRSQSMYRRMGTSVTCSNCGQYGHNRRHCPNSIVSVTGLVEPGFGAHAAGAATRGRGRRRGARLGRGRGRGRGYDEFKLELLLGVGESIKGGTNCRETHAQEENSEGKCPTTFSFQRETFRGIRALPPSSGAIKMSEKLNAKPHIRT
ncbi:hypothetical protein Ahy_A03g012856 [Arachis hypogaea]|uniref:CCHC-type domain-containing protein n=1 Tax=Arachis hypogaea TaxID=3818 RepID=A0A445DUK6_ARAHY|nr:hypothetical protein Ahy_A03g012856 [Arachis hypogaea]